MGSPPSVEPLAPRWHLATLAESRAGVATRAVIGLENAGTATWRSVGADGLQVSYHWLDLHGNAIVWDGTRSPLPHPIAPGASSEVAVEVVAPRAPGRYRLRFDLVEEHHFWLSEIGADVLDIEVEVAPRIAARRLEVVVHGGPHPATSRALARQEEPIVADAAVATAHLVSGAEPDPSWACLLLDAHAEGWTAVGPALVPGGGSFRRRRSAHWLGPWATGGRNPRFDLPLLLPSLLAGVEPTTSEGLPAYRGDEGLFEGGAVVRLPTQYDRRLH
jgi:hypothetical protein